MPEIEIACFSQGAEADVLSLILPIQRDEFGLDISAEDQPDLMQIPSFYQIGQGDFWVARYQNMVIGTLGLKDIGNGNAALRKMFVARAWRGKENNVAERLLNTLINAAQTRGIQRIYLGTTDKFLAAHRFYEKKGFALTEPQALPPDFPLMSVDTRFYTLII